jgi:hypothetical protein
MVGMAGALGGGGGGLQPKKKKQQQQQQLFGNADWVENHLRSSLTNKNPTRGRSNSDPVRTARTKQTKQSTRPFRTGGRLL